MEYLEDREFRIFCLLLLIFYMATGFYGALWISDEFDWLRSMVYSILTVPATALFLTYCALTALWWKKWPKLFYTLLATILMTSSWGNFLLLNAISENQKTLVSQTLEERAVNVAHYRGGLGWLYRKRW